MPQPPASAKKPGSSKKAPAPSPAPASAKKPGSSRKASAPSPAPAKGPALGQATPSSTKSTPKPPTPQHTAEATPGPSAAIPHKSNTTTPKTPLAATNPQTPHARTTASPDRPKRPAPQHPPASPAAPVRSAKKHCPHPPSSNRSHTPTAHPPAHKPATPHQQPPPGPTHGTMVALHRSRLLDWSPPAVVALAPRGDGALLAVGYEDGAVEAWDTTNWAPRLLLPGGEGSKLRALAWVKEPPAGGVGGRWRLFTASLDGMIREVDPDTSGAAHASDACGGAIWALVACPAAAAGTSGALLGQLAAACDDGSVRLLDVEEGQGGALYRRMLAKVEGRVLSVAWHPNGHMLAGGGSDGCIHCWHAGTGRELLRITAGVQTRGEPLCVWVVLVLPDGALVSGDSTGAVQFWDAVHGTLLSRFSIHKADVLALAASSDGSSVFASGIDSQVALFTFTPDKATGSSAWAYLHYKRPHTHDVRSLAVLQPRGEGQDPLLVSGGADSQIIAYSASNFLKQHPVRVCKAPRRPQVSLALSPAAPPQGSLASCPPPRMLSSQGKILDLWQLATAVADPMHPPHPHHHHPSGAHSNGASTPHPHHHLAEGEPIDLRTSPLHLLRIEATSDTNLRCSAISPDGTRVAASDSARLRLFRISTPASPGSAHPSQAPPSASKISLAPAAQRPAVALSFSRDSQALFSAAADGSLSASSTSDGAELASWLPKHAPGDGPAAVEGRWSQLPVALLVASPSGACVATLGSAGVNIHNASTLQRERQLLPGGGGGAAVAAAEFNASGTALAVAWSDNTVKVLAVRAGGQTQWSIGCGGVLAKSLEKLPGSITGLSFNPGPAAADSLVAYTAGGFCHVDMSKPALHEVDQVKRMRGPRRPSEQPRRDTGRNLRLIPLEHPCLHLAFTGPSSMLLLERPWEHVLAALPPPLYRHRYSG